MNLTNLASKRYNGLVHDNSIGVESAPNNKGFTVITKKRKLAVSIDFIDYRFLCNNLSWIMFYIRYLMPI